MTEPVIGSAEPTEENIKKALAMSMMLSPEQRIGVFIREIQRLENLPESERSVEDPQKIRNYEKAIGDMLAKMDRKQRRRMFKPEYKASALIRKAIK